MSYVIHERWYIPGGRAVLRESRAMSYGDATATLMRWRRASIDNALGLSDFWLVPL